MTVKSLQHGLYGSLIGGVIFGAGVGAGLAYGFAWWVLGPLTLMPLFMGMWPPPSTTISASPCKKSASGHTHVYEPLKRAQARPQGPNRA